MKRVNPLLQEGAENLRKVARDKKSVSDVNTIVKKSNSKLTEMHQELQELESQILVSSQTPNAAGVLTLKIIFCLEKLCEGAIQSFRWSHGLLRKSRFFRRTKKRFVP